MAALPGTKHQSGFDRREAAILNAICAAPSVRKVETLRFEQTRPTRRLRLSLRPGVFFSTVEEVFEGWLFIGAGKRLALIVPVHGATLAVLAADLAARLQRHGVSVEVAAGRIKQEEEIMQIKDVVILNPEKSWRAAERVHEAYVEVKAIEDREFELQLQIEELQKALAVLGTQKEELKLATLEALADMLSGC